MFYKVKRKKNTWSDLIFLSYDNLVFKNPVYNELKIVNSYST